MSPAVEFEHWFSVIQKDLVRVYVWYRLAVNSGYDQAIADMERIDKAQLSSEQRGEAKRLLNALASGQCAKDTRYLRSHEPEYSVQSSD